MRLPKNVVMQYPSGRWGFVGRVDSRLADRSWPTREAAIDALIDITPIDYGPVPKPVIVYSEPAYESAP